MMNHHHHTSCDYCLLIKQFVESEKNSQNFQRMRATTFSAGSGKKESFSIIAKQTINASNAESVNDLQTYYDHVFGSCNVSKFYEIDTM